jgi:hypothetical protein
METVDRAVRIERGLHVSLHIGGFRHVSGDEQHLAAVLANNPGSAIAPGGITIHHDHLGAFARKPQRGRSAHAPPVTSATLPLKSMALPSACVGG